MNTINSSSRRVSIANSAFGVICNDAGTADLLNLESNKTIVGKIETRTNLETKLISADVSILEINQYDCDDATAMYRKKKSNNEYEPLDEVTPELVMISTNLYTISNAVGNVERYVMYGMTGQKVKITREGNYNFNLNGLVKGIYILNFSINGKDYSEKLVVQ